VRVPFEKRDQSRLVALADLTQHPEPAAEEPDTPEEEVEEREDELIHS
jgi:hypothetical protein